jgi:hypothetical protein
MTRATTRLIFATAALAAAMLTAPVPAQAAPYWPWCAQNYDRSSAHYCGFISWEQCMDTVRGGRGGHCYHNLAPPPAAYRSARKRYSAARD